MDKNDQASLSVGPKGSRSKTTRSIASFFTSTTSEGVIAADEISQQSTERVRLSATSTDTPSAVANASMGANIATSVSSKRSKKIIAATLSNVTTSKERDADAANAVNELSSRSKKRTRNKEKVADNSSSGSKRQKSIQLTGEPQQQMRPTIAVSKRVKTPSLKVPTNDVKAVKNAATVGKRISLGKPEPLRTTPHDDTHSNDSLLPSSESLFPTALKPATTRESYRKKQIRRALQQSGQSSDGASSNEDDVPPSKFTTKFFADEADCSDGSPDETETNASESASIRDFIVDDLGTDIDDDSSVPPIRETQPGLRSILKRKFKPAAPDLLSTHVTNQRKRKAGATEDTPNQPKRRGRPQGAKTAAERRMENVVDFTYPVGDSRYPETQWSLTISKTKCDVPVNLLDIIILYLRQVTIKAIISNESGARKHNLHLQSCFTVYWPKTKQACAALCQQIKALLPLKGKGYMVMLKPFGATQHWSAMIGYCMKDVRKPHFQSRTHNVPIEEINHGRDFHSLLTSSNFADKNTIILTHRKILPETFKFIARAMFPVIPPPEVAIAYMIQSGAYSIDSSWISSRGGKMNHRDCSTILRLGFEPESASFEQCERLFFDIRTLGPFYSEGRYFELAANLVPPHGTQVLRPDPSLVRPVSTPTNETTEGVPSASHPALLVEASLTDLVDRNQSPQASDLRTKKTAKSVPGGKAPRNANLISKASDQRTHAEIDSSAALSVTTDDNAMANQSLAQTFCEPHEQHLLCHTNRDDEEDDNDFSFVRSGQDSDQDRHLQERRDSLNFLRMDSILHDCHDKIADLLGQSTSSSSQDPYAKHTQMLEDIGEQAPQPIGAQILQDTYSLLQPFSKRLLQEHAPVRLSRMQKILKMIQDASPLTPPEKKRQPMSEDFIDLSTACPASFRLQLSKDHDDTASETASDIAIFFDKTPQKIAPDFVCPPKWPEMQLIVQEYRQKQFDVMRSMRLSDLPDLGSLRNDPAFQKKDYAKLYEGTSRIAKRDRSYDIYEQHSDDEDADGYANQSDNDDDDDDDGDIFAASDDDT